MGTFQLKEAKPASVDPSLFPNGCGVPAQARQSQAHSPMENITITSVVINDDITSITNTITLSDGRLIDVWNGSACYCSPAEASGPLEIGSVLIFEEELEDGAVHYVFA
jgi:hypothetical protein